MKAIFTGLNGTVAPYVKKHFEAHGYEVIPYDRNKVPIDDDQLIREFFNDVNPDLVIHFAMGPVSWTAILARLSYEKNIKFVYISTVSVFSNENFGPHDILSIPDATDDYGQYKRNSEEITRKVNPNAYIIRLGWQIGYEKGTNNMIDFLSKKMEQDGIIHASDSWYPSTSFIKDTAGAIYQIVTDLNHGLYHVNSNDNLTFYEIVKGLTTMYPEFKVEKTNDFKADHRMVDERVEIPKLSEIFKK